MGEQKEKKKPSKHICTALLAHVDAGKTTLSEGILYLNHVVRKMGRVDNQDSFFDTDEMERQRGITIFSKQAVLDMEGVEFTLLDTPGHVDFSTEMERTLQVLDYAILIVSGADGVQGHTMTLWRLLKAYQIPVFLFINKMDQNGTEESMVLKELKERLDPSCIDFSSMDFSSEKEGVFPEELLENIAMCDDKLLDCYMEQGTVKTNDIIEAIANRKLFPCFFGSALKMQGVSLLVKAMRAYMKMPSYSETFGAKVYKISRDEQENRLTHLKITGGSLKVKQSIGEEKVNQIRIYSGVKYETKQEVYAGEICAVTGLNETKVGQGLGVEEDSFEPVLAPILVYKIILPQDCDPHRTFLMLKQLEDEEPQLNLIWDENVKEIQAQLMGEIQIEVLKDLIWKRYHLVVEFGQGNIVYKETIAHPVEGVGHFEPLRHYAEVHLLMEPGKRGSGMQFHTDCNEDFLQRNWQRLILTHLEEREHKGVLVGGRITDMKITVIGGRAHQKHTEGGDFRQATYRAIRQGLMQAESILLEPYYQFRLEIPSECIGRALSDIERMSGKAEVPQLEGKTAIINGIAPVSKMQGYQTEVIAYTKGLGRFFSTNGGYFPCHNQDEVLNEIEYEAENDSENPSSSVFCAHGAGFIVPWNQVQDYMHVDGILLKKKTKDSFVESVKQTQLVDDYDFEDNYVPRYKPVEYEKNRAKIIKAKREQRVVEKEKVPEYLLVDGYNIIFAWDELRELAKVNLDSARDRLIDILCNYQGQKGVDLILVFDAYKVKENPGSNLKHHNIQVVFTKEAETADMYIEKFAHQMGHKYTVTVATSDGVEQVIIRGKGCLLMSAKELKEDVEITNQMVRDKINEKNPKNKNYALAHAIDKITIKETKK